jgi:uncharacterized protein (TIGR03435 family)
MPKSRRVRVGGRTVLRLVRIVTALAEACIFSAVAAAQPQQTPPKLPQFDAVSIRPAGPNAPANWGYLPDGFNAENVTLAPLIMEAYGLKQEQGHQLLGLPKWAESAHYAILAKVAESDMPVMKTLRYSQRGKMLQPILEDRFSLRCHWEKRSMSAYTLELSGKGTKLKDATSEDSSKTVAVGQATLGAGALIKTANGRVIARAVPISMLVSELAGELDTYVIDDTGLKGKYDFDMQLSSVAAHDDSPSDQSEPKELVQDGLSQIGLRLVPSKADLPVLVIDELKPPSPN